MKHSHIVMGAALGLAVGLAGTTSASAATNLIQNGSFESTGNGTFSGPGGVANWTMGGSVGDGFVPVTIQYNQNSEYPTGAQGEAVPTDNAPSLSPDGAGNSGVYFVSDQAHQVSINQTIFLTPGSYDIGFDSYFTNNGFAEPGDSTFTANIAGVQLANIDLNGITPGVWTTHQGEADILTAGNYLVSFTFNSPQSPEFAKDIVIDQAYVLAASDGGGTPISNVPEPASWLLMTAGIGGIGLALRRNKRTLGKGALIA
jgi:hypothetical protein